MSGWIMETLDYRWLWGTQGIGAASAMILLFLFVEESRVGVIQSKLLKKTGEGREVGEVEEKMREDEKKDKGEAMKDFGKLVGISIKRPFGKSNSQPYPFPTFIEH